MQDKDRIIQAIRDCLADCYFSGKMLHTSYSAVVQTHYGVAHTPNHDRIIEVIYNYEVIALIEPNVCRISLYNAGTIGARSRIKAILAEFAPDWSIRMSKGQPYLLDRDYAPQLFYQGFYTTFNAWHPKRASRWNEPTSAAC